MVEKIAKICWNDFHWIKPSGSNGKSPSSNTFENSFGFGHEEWVMDKSKVIDQYHYGFLQALHLKSNRHVGKVYKMWLYAISGGVKYLIGHIREVHCISKEESIEAFRSYQKNGWIKEMKHDLHRAGVNSKIFSRVAPETFFNMKFFPNSLERLDNYRVISDKDRNITTTRYKLLDKVSEFYLLTSIPNDSEGYLRKGIDEVFVDPYHKMMQEIVIKALRKSGAYVSVQKEVNNVDVVGVTKNGAVHFYEIKTDSPKRNIRNAMGQLLEYCLFPECNKAKRLFVVGDSKPNLEVTKYLRHLRKSITQEIYYRWLDVEGRFLSEEI